MGYRTKRSGGRSPTLEPPEPTFFVDRDLASPTFLDFLRASGKTVESHNDHFGASTPDVEWIAAVAARGWVAISGNTAIARTPHERLTVLECGLRLFLLASSNRNHVVLARNLVNTWPRILRVIKQQDGAFIAKVTRPGDLAELLGKPGEVSVMTASTGKE